MPFQPAGGTDPPPVHARIRHGYREASGVERAGFGVLSSFAGTVAIARAVNYVRERQRHMPRVRGALRRIYNTPRSGGTRVHHFVPGVALAFGAGGAAVVTRTEGSELRFALPFGVGAGLTLDEVALLIDVDNPYWRSEGFAVVQAVVAGSCAVALGVGFARRGRAST